MIKAIAIDDEPLALELIETFCRRFDFIQYNKGFSNTALAFQYIEKNPVDLLFLDINMPAVSGVEFYKSLPHKPMLVFTTSFSEYALESYELEAIDYLLKPFTAGRFEKALLKAKAMHDLVHNAILAGRVKHLMLKADYGMVRIVLTDILFIEGLDNYLKIHLQNQAPAVVRLTMKSLMEKLHENEFIRVHRSYIVPIHRIDSIKQRMIQVAGEEIPVGRNYEEHLKAVLSQGS